MGRKEMETIDNYASYIANFPNRINKHEKNRAAIIKKYTRRFIIKVNFELQRFCGNDEYIRPKNVIELLAISTLCKALVKLIDDQNEFGGTELKKILDDASQKAIAAVFDNIPYREVKEANSICRQFISIIHL